MFVQRRIFLFYCNQKKMLCPHQEPGGEADWCLLQEQHEEGEQTEGKAVWGHTGEQLVALVGLHNIQDEHLVAIVVLHNIQVSN